MPHRVLGKTELTLRKSKPRCKLNFLQRKRQIRYFFYFITKQLVSSYLLLNVLTMRDGCWRHVNENQGVIDCFHSSLMIV